MTQRSQRHCHPATAISIEPLAAAAAWMYHRGQRSERAMTAMKPVAGLDTHAVVNQPPPFENINMFETDRALKTAVTCAGGGAHSRACRGLARM